MSLYVRLPLYTFHKLYVNNMNRCGKRRYLPYQKLRLAWLAFMDLLNMDQIGSSGYMCAQCGSHPSIIICDGITLSMQKKHMLPRRDEEAAADVKLQGSKFVSLCSKENFSSFLLNEWNM